MAVAASARRLEESVPVYADDSLRAVEYEARPRRLARPAAASRPRWGRLLVIFVVCLALLAAGRVAMSFAVVQKSVATDAVAVQQQQLASENAQLAEELAQLGSTVRISTIAKTELGLIEATHVKYLKAAKSRGAATGKEP